MNMQSKELLDRTINTLRKQHVRITEQRMIIIRYMIQTKDHPTAEEIYQDLSKDYRSMSLATVYNNLNLLVDKKLVREIHTRGKAVRFDFNDQEHYHLICDSCGKIVDFFYTLPEDLDEKAEYDTGFEVSGHHLELYGLCVDCQKKRAQQEKEGTDSDSDQNRDQGLAELKDAGKKEEATV